MEFLALTTFMIFVTLLGCKLLTGEMELGTFPTWQNLSASQQHRALTPVLAPVPATIGNLTMNSRLLIGEFETPERKDSPLARPAQAAA